MNPQPPNPRSVFGRAVEIDSPADRRAYLDQACAGAPEVRDRVEALLRAHDDAGGFLRPHGADPDATDGHTPSPDAPAAVGPYKLLEKIGEGGMGEVWVADQLEPIKRRVALKLIKPGMDSRGVLARFEAERQALAVMDHPNIARVLDAGTTDDGRPYFVMELVKGTPITEFCDIRKLTPKERLELFVPVCQAIQHAHMKGIIHRDIKPSNVLVELHDDRPVPKVIDFGVAKAIGQRLTEKTIYTGFGALVGTPAYMAPEQATFNALDVDTRADVYALGVLLYELLAGSPPIEKDRLKQAALDEVLRIVRDEEPVRPSQRLSTSQTKASIAATRQSEPGALSQMMKGELDWIVMKALEKDRTRRYDTASNFAADVQRYLTGEQVQAVPPSLGYRLKKAYRRNRAAVLTGLTFALVLATGVVAASLLAVWATNAERMAAADRDVALAAEKVAVDQREAAQSARDHLREALYVSDLQMAVTMWQAKDRARTLEVLDRQRPPAGEPDLRGFEWHFLNRESRSATHSLSLPEGIKRITPDGRRVYLALAAGRRKDGKPGSTFRSWDLETGTEFPEWEPFPGETVSFLAIAGFSRTGDRALVACRFGQPQDPQPFEYRVLDLETHKALFSLTTDERMLTPLMDGVGRLIAVHKRDEKYSPEPKVSIWNVTERKVERVLSVDTAKGEMFGDFGRAFHPNGKQFAAVVLAPGPASDFHQLRVWDLQSGAEVWRLPVEAVGFPATLVYSPDGKYLVESHSESDVINLRNSQDGKILSKLRIPGVDNRNMPKFLWFSLDGSKLAVSLGSQTGVHVWDVSAAPSSPDLSPLRSIPTDVSSNRVGFTADGRSVIVASIAASDLSMYNLASQAVPLNGPDAIRSPFHSGPDTIKRPVFVVGPSGNSGLAWALWKVESPGSPKAEVRVWEATGREVFRVQFDSLEDWYSGITTRDGKRLILIQSSTHRTDPAQDRSRIQVWDMETRTELSVGEVPGGRVSIWGIDPDGRTLVISRLQQPRPLRSGDQVRTRLSCWDLSNHREIHGIDIDGQVNGSVLSQDGTRVAWSVLMGAPKFGKELRVCDAKTGQVVWLRTEWGEPGGTTQPGTPVFSRDGQTLVVATAWGSRGDQLFVLDAATGRDLLPPIHSPDGSLHNLRVSEDGRRLFALASIRRTSPIRSESAVVWDLRTGRKLLTLPADTAQALTIDREGRRVYLVKESIDTGKPELKLESFDGTPRPEPKK